PLKLAGVERPGLVLSRFGVPGEAKDDAIIAVVGHARDRRIGPEFLARWVGIEVVALPGGGFISVNPSLFVVTVLAAKHHQTVGAGFVSKAHAVARRRRIGSRQPMEPVGVCVVGEQ